MNKEILEVLRHAAKLVISRDTDVNIYNGVFATVDVNELLKLEAAIIEAFELSNDELLEIDMEVINNSLDGL